VLLERRQIMEIVRFASLVKIEFVRLNGSSFNQIVFEVVERASQPNLLSKIENNRNMKDA
jgi:hypothetical protein